MDRFDKIFIIGFNKTATKTLHTFFKQNGLRSIHWHGGKLATTMVRNALSGRKILRGYDWRYRVYSDMIYLTDRMCVEANSFYRILDRDYPGSAFIYNTRDEDAWVKSRMNHASGKFLETYLKAMNTTSVAEVENHWRDTRRRFEKELLSYFSGRENLLVFDIESMEPSAIRSFLGMDLDLSKFAWVNRTADRQRVTDESAPAAVRNAASS